MIECPLSLIKGPKKEKNKVKKYLKSYLKSLKKTASLGMTPFLNNKHIN